MAAGDSKCSFGLFPALCEFTENLQHTDQVGAPRMAFAFGDVTSQFFRWVKG